MTMQMLALPAIQFTGENGHDIEEMFNGYRLPDDPDDADDFDDLWERATVVYRSDDQTLEVLASALVEMRPDHDSVVIDVGLDNATVAVGDWIARVSDRLLVVRGDAVPDVWDVLTKAPPPDFPRLGVDLVPDDLLDFTGDEDTAEQVRGPAYIPWVEHSEGSDEELGLPYPATEDGWQGAVAAMKRWADDNGYVMVDCPEAFPDGPAGVDKVIVGLAPL